MNSTTEAASKRYAMIEDWPASDLVEGIVEGQFAAIAAVSAASTVIAAAAEAICKRLESGGRLVYCGAGTSGRLATLDAAERSELAGLLRRVLVDLGDQAPA